MSAIKDIIERNEMLSDRGHPIGDYTEHNNLLRALDVIADELHRVADAILSKYT